MLRCDDCDDLRTGHNPCCGVCRSYRRHWEPSPEEFAADLAEIQAGWSQADRAKRQVMSVQHAEVTLVCHVTSGRRRTKPARAD